MILLIIIQLLLLPLRVITIILFHIFLVLFVVLVFFLFFFLFFFWFCSDEDVMMHVWFLGLKNRFCAGLTPPKGPCCTKSSTALSPRTESIRRCDFTPDPFLTPAVWRPSRPSALELLLLFWARSPQITPVKPFFYYGGFGESLRCRRGGRIQNRYICVCIYIHITYKYIYIHIYTHIHVYCFQFILDW